MLRKTLTLATLTGIALAGLLWTRPAVGVAPSAGYSTDVRISKSQRTPGAYSIRVEVRDLASGNAVAAPEILVRASERAEVENSFGEDSACKVEATVDPGTKTATYSVVITKQGAPIAEHQAKVTID